MPLQRTTIHSLSCVIDDDGTPPSRLVVLCHGYGAPGEDLVGLGGELRRAGLVPPGTRFLFPAAPLDVPMAFGGRAWWPLDGERIFEKVARGALDDIYDEVPEGLASARRALTAVVETALNDAGLGYDALVLAGFSQGSMLAMDLTLRLDEPPAALCLFSSIIICRDQWRQRAPKRRGLKVFMAHGRQDQLLPLAGAVALKDLLTTAGCEVQWHEFDGGHTIDGGGLHGLASLISG
jgi:phospholipase/carboxylesterase